MNRFIPGQRVISDAELKMGLGTIIKSDMRTVTVHYESTTETRTYSQQTAPLTRITFAIGDLITSYEGWKLRVERLHESDGIITYFGHREDGTEDALPEAELDHHIHLNRPTDRLFNGQLDHDKWFNLRTQTLTHLSRVQQSPLYGLIGARTAQIPHQLYIAHEVSKRFAPRVLLADEVGLGKTIEAGLILHRQILTEQAQRVLIVVPESLIHQWIVEMLRRFNLSFSLFDEERCVAVEQSSELENPFQAEQLIIVSLESLVNHAHRHQQVLTAGWDLLVVDEAHHLLWSPGQASPQYQAIESLANSISGVLLLTATPEQLGKESHFARLRLLDPDRFPDFEQFLKEEKSYEPIAIIVEQLIAGGHLSSEQISTIQGYLSSSENEDLINALNQNAHLDDVQRESIITHLLDRHGTGRVLFRNTRSAIKGFPKRMLNTYALPLPQQYRTALDNFSNSAINDPQALLSPERLYEHQADVAMPDWDAFDPRVKWLEEKVKDLYPHKVLIISSSASTAIDLAQTLKARAGIQASMFHEGMSLIERDRAAAWFADMEFGAQILICSEIGSEGRNFQFAHHLVMFDLPLNPDLLEQRIGRLDRIGQNETIQIHIPYLESSPQQIMTEWYQNGLNAFEQTTPAGQMVFTQVRDELLESLHQMDTGSEELEGLIKTTANIHKQYLDEMQNGRDLLLEYNSCRTALANRLVAAASAEDDDQQIDEYLETLFDCYGIDSELHSTKSMIIRPSESMQHHFPELNEEGMTITTDRATALANEDIAFINWEHPMITSSMEMVLSNEIGNSTLSAIKHDNVKPGTLLLETIFIVETAAKRSLHTSRYLPSMMIRVVVDPKGRDYSERLPLEEASYSTTPVNKETSAAVINSYKEPLKQMVHFCEAIANKQSEVIIQKAQTSGTMQLQDEISRLEALSKINPTIREEEITFFKDQLKALQQALSSATIRLDAQRVLVGT